MYLTDYIRHYLSFPGLLFFLLVSLAVVILIHVILLITAKNKAMHYRQSDRVFAMTDLFNRYTERYYELMLSATSTLFFTGIFFLIDFDYFSVSAGTWAFWESYRDFILLAFIIVSIILISIVDHFFIPLRIIEKEEKSTLRMAGMLYMLIIFAYIKFIYLDDNYDAILFYFITMIIGRFVYFDAASGAAVHSTSGTVWIQKWLSADIQRRGSQHVPGTLLCHFGNLPDYKSKAATKDCRTNRGEAVTPPHF